MIVPNEDFPPPGKKEKTGNNIFWQGDGGSCWFYVGWSEKKEQEGGSEWCRYGRSEQVHSEGVDVRCVMKLTSFGIQLIYTNQQFLKESNHWMRAKTLSTQQSAIALAHLIVQCLAPGWANIIVIIIIIIIVIIIICDCTGSPNSAVPGTRVRIVTSLLLFSNIYHSNEFLLNNSFTLQMRKKIVMTDVTWKPAFTKVCKSNLNEVSWEMSWET